MADLESDPGLAYAAGARERQEPNVVRPQAPHDRVDFTLPTERPVRRRGQAPAARAPSPFPGGAQLLRVQEDRALERAQRLAWLEPHLRDEPVAGGPEGGKRIRLATRSVQGQHLKLHQALIERMGQDQRLERAEHLRVAAQLDVELDRFDHRTQPLLL